MTPTLNLEDEIQEQATRVRAAIEKLKAERIKLEAMVQQQCVNLEWPQPKA